MAKRAVQAAGGVLYRMADAEPEFLLARRPRYKDWTLPKGKLDKGETPLEAALREVEEETGFGCRVERAIGSISYELGSGRRKAVRYWLMLPQHGEFTPNSEVDKIRWLPINEALTRLSYRKERAVLSRASEMIRDPEQGRIYLVRHALAGTRTDSKTDSKRRLSKKGVRHALKLARRLSREPITEIRSSPFPRCVDTVKPLARAMALPVVKDNRLAEAGTIDDLFDLFGELGGTTPAFSSHGDMIQMLIEHLDAKGIDLGDTVEWKKGSVWTLDTYKGEVVRGRYRKPPS